MTEALKGVRQRGGIAIVIAHRPSALAAVDLVGLIQNGKLAAPRARAVLPQSRRRDAGLDRFDARPNAWLWRQDARCVRRCGRAKGLTSAKMDDRLALGLPNHEELDALKNRFALRESRSRVNSISAVPFLIGAFAALLKKMFETEQKVSDKHPGELSDHNSKEDKHASDIKDDPVMTQIQKIGEVADFLRSLAEPISVNVPDLNFDVWQPHRPWGVQGLHSAHRSGVGNSIHGAGGRGGSPPPVAGNDNGGRSLPPGGALPGQGEGDNSHGGSGSGGRGGSSGGQGTQPGQSDPGQGSQGSTKTNRRPVLTGPVFLSDGMMNLSVISPWGSS